MSRRLMFCATLLLAAPAAAFAHFPYLHVESAGGTPDLRAYFGHGVEVMPEKYFPRLEGATVWRRDSGGATRSVSLRRSEGCLAAPVTPGPAAYGFEKEGGVITLHGPAFLSFGTAKAYSGPDAWGIDTADKLALDIAPRRDGDRLTLTVRWQGQPLSGATVLLERGDTKQEGTTNAAGQFVADLSGPGLYTARAVRLDPTAGDRDGQHYESVRHTATLTMDVK